MEPTTNVNVKINVTSSTAGVEQTKAALNSLGTATDVAAAKQAEIAKGAGIVAMAFTVVGIAAVAAGVYSMKSASDFQASMLLIQTQAGASAQEVRNMTQAVLELAPALGQTPQQLAEGLYYVESAGYRGAIALDILTAAAKEAAIGHADLTDTSKSLTSILNSGVAGFSNYTQAVGIMDATIGGGKMTLTDFNAAIATGIMPTLKAAGISFQQFGGALDVFTNSGIPAVDASARLRMSIGLMVTQSGPYTKAVEGMGMASNQLAKDMQSGGLLKAIQDLHSHLQGLSQIKQEEILGKMFGSRESATMMTLIQNVGSLGKDMEHVQATSNNFSTNWAATQKTADFASKDFNATIQTLVVTFGMKLLPAYTDVVNFLSGTVEPAFKNLATFVEKNHTAFAILAGVLTGVVALGLIAIGVAIAPVIAAVGAFLLAWGPVAIVVAGVATLIMMYWKQISTATIKFVNDHKALFTDMWNTIKGIFTYTLGYLQGYWSTIWGAIAQIGKGIWEELSGAFEIFMGLLEIIFGVFQAVFTGNWNEAWKGIKKGFTDIWDGIVLYLKGILDVMEGLVKFWIDSFIGNLNGLINGIDKASGGKLNIPQIPHLASGTNYFSGGVALVGENGPELVNLPTGSQVIPNNKTNNYNQGVTINNTNIMTNTQDVNAVAKMMGLQVNLASH